MGGADHRRQHLGGGDRRLRCLAGKLDQPLLRPGHLLERQLDPEVATGDHDPALGRRDDLGGPLGGLRLLDLGDQGNVGAAGTDRGVHTVEVSRAADEGDRKQVDAVAAGEVDPLLVGVTGVRELRVGARQVHPLVGADRAARLHLAGDIRVGDREHLEPNPAVGEEDRIRFLHRPAEARPLHRQPFGVPGRPVGGARKDDGRAGVEHGDVALEVAEPQFRAREVAEDADLSPGPLGGVAYSGDDLGVLVRGRVREAEPEDIDPGIEQLPQHLRLAAGGADGGDDLRPAAGVAHRANASGSATSWAIDSNTSRAPASRNSAAP
jgi:hypothetical protein